MKIALCLYGKVGGTSSKVMNSISCSEDILTIGHSHYNEYLFNNADVDTYIHSWSFSLKDKIIDLYKPIDYIIEKQEVFNIPRNIPGKEERKQGHYSRWKSTYQVVNLLEKSNKEYDLVILSRPDLMWKIKPEPLDLEYFYVQQWCCFGDDVDLYNSGQFNKSKRIDISNLKHWHKPIGTDIRDWWFFSSKENIVNFGKLYEKIDNYAMRGCLNGVISNHGMCEKRLKDINLFDKLKAIHHLTDTPLIRREVFKSFK